MAGGARIMVCKILDSFNSGLTSHLIAATSYARLAGADIINLSLQNYPFSSSLQTEFNRCESNGVLLCICAGNNSQNNDGTPNYPSCYTNANIIAVGNHTRSDARYTTSSYGLTSVDLFAPGRDILSPVSSGGYSLFTGTSMSTPFVAGTAALIKALNPTWKAAQIKQCLLNTVTIRAAYSNLCVTGGRLNAAAAVTKAVKSLPANDADGDGVASLVEYGARTDASDARSRPVFTTCFTTGTFQLVLNATVRTDVVFRVEHSTNLLAWSTNGVQNLGTSNVFSQGASVTGRPVLFQRIQAVAAP
jgi:subtilisin family serine protease